MKKNLFSATVFMVILLLSLQTTAQSDEAATSCVQQASGLISLWGGDNNALDLMGSNNGTLTNGATYATGKVGQAFSFDGVDDYVVTPLVASVTDGVTLNAWVKWGGSNASNARQVIMYNGNYDSTGYGIFSENSGTITLLIGQGTPAVLTTNAALVQGTWQHVAAVRAAGTWIVYLNGQAVSIVSGDPNTAPNTPTTNAMVGGSGDATLSFKGLIDEVGIYNRALSASEVEAVYNADSAGVCRQCTPTPSGAISLWKGDNNANDSVGSNNGTLMSGATFTTGKSGQALRFDGVDDYVSLSDVDFKSNVPRSMAFWVKTSDAGDPITFGHLKGAFFGRGNGTTQHLHLGIASGKQTIEWYDSGAQSIQGTSNIADNNWHHLVFVSDGAGTVSLYVDGALENSGAFVHTSGSTSTRLGSQYEGNPIYSYFFNGSLDEVLFFDRALSASEIAAIYGAGCAGTCPSGLVSWWKGNGDANDSLGTYNGTLTNGATFAQGQQGTAFSFDGSDDYVQTAYTFPFTSDFTIGVWMKPQRMGGLEFVVGTEDGFSGSGGGWLLYWNNPDNSGKIAFGAGCGGNNWTYSSTANSYAVDQWHHVVGMFAGSVGRIYVDGVLDVEFPKTCAIIAGTNLRMGMYPNTMARPYKGLLDDVRVFNRALSATEVDLLRGPDTVPDVFSFTAQTGVTLTTLVSSNTITVAGINIAAPISITNGEYQINGGSWILSSGTVNNGDTVTVRQTTSSSFSTKTDAVLTIGGVSGTFSATTQAADAIPDAFSFADQTDVLISTLVSSNTITVSGMNTVATISIAGGEYRVNSGLWSSSAGTANSGDTITVRQTSSASYSTKTDATLTIGGVSDTFSITTMAAPQVTLPFHEDFNGTISSYWQITNPVPDSASLNVNPGNLRLTITETDPIVGINNTANLYTVPLPADADNYQVTAKLAFPTVPSLLPQQAGILLLADNNGVPDQDNYLRIMYALENGARRVELVRETNGAATVINTTTPVELDPNQPIWLRIQKAGTGFTLQYSLDGQTYFTFYTLTGSWTMAHAGLFAIDGVGYNNPLIPVDFDFFEVASIPGSTKPCTGVPAGLISWWPGDGSAKDLTALNNGTLMNGVQFVEGKVGQAIQFDGVDDYIEIANNPSLNPINTITVEAWFRPESFAGNGNNAIITKGFTSRIHPYYQYHLGMAGDQYGGSTKGTFSFSVSPGNTFTLAETDSNTWVPGSWYHVVGTYDGSSVKIYVNGTLRATTPASGTMTDYGMPVRLGAFNEVSGQPDFFTPGTLDEARIFDRALTSDEILNIYQAASTGMCKGGLVQLAGQTAWWRGEGDSVDSTGGHDGSLGTGSATFGQGIYGKAFDLNGSTCYNIPNGLIVPSDHAYTIEAFVYPRVNNMVFYNSVAGGGGEVTFSPTGVGTHLSPDSWQSADASVAMNTWTHRMGIRRNGVLELWDKGSPVATTGISDVNPVSGDNAYRSLIGCWYDPYGGGYKSFYSGLVDELRLYMRALSTDEIALRASGMPDTTPDIFTFTSQTGVTISTLVTSNTITITSINAGAAISVTGGVYQVNGGSWTSLDGTVNNNDTVKVRQTSSGNFLTETIATLAIGGVPGTFSVTTQAADTTPDAFSFAAVNNVSLSTLYTSSSVTVSGINTGAPISITNGSYSINSGLFTSASGTVNNGDTVRVKLVSSATYSASASATLTIGGVPAVFSVTTIVDPLKDGTDTLLYSSLTWSTGGDAPWFNQTAVSYSGNDALQSGLTGANGKSWIQTTVTGPFSIAFYQKVSSQAGYDFLTFTIDGVVKSKISGEVNWQQKAYSIVTSGTHTFSWTYSKNASITKGLDAGWLDKVVVSPNTKVTVLSQNLGGVVSAGTITTITWSAPANAEKFKLFYSIDNGLTWKAILAATDYVTGTSYDWTVPAQNGNKTACKVKVAGYNAASVAVGSDLSDKPFTIEVVKVTAPNGGEALTSGVVTPISYTISATTSTATSVLIAYTLDNVNWKTTDTVTTGIVAGANTYAWTPPAVTATKTTCKLRVTLRNAANTAIGTDQSDASFTIEPMAALVKMTLMAKVPSNTPPADTITLRTGMIFGADEREVTMTKVAGVANTWQATITAPEGTLLRYRYSRNHDWNKGEVYALRSHVDGFHYRQILVKKDVIVAEAIAQWKDTTAVATGTLVGTVTDTGGNPLMGIRVSAGPHQTMTRYDGTYRVRGVPAGPCAVTIWSDNGEYRPVTLSASVPPDDTAAVNANLSAADMAEVTFQVTVPASTPANAVPRLYGDAYRLGMFPYYEGSAIDSTRMIDMAQAGANTWTYTATLGKGSCYQYLYTLGYNRVNNEHTSAGAIVTRTLCVDGEMTVHDTVAAWKAPGQVPVTLNATAPAAAQDALYVTTDDWGGYGPMKMWSTGAGTATFVIYANANRTLKYRYVRNGDPAIGMEIVPSGPDQEPPLYRNITTGTAGKTVNDAVSVWRHQMRETLPDPVVTSMTGTVVSRATGSAFQTGVELIDYWRPSWRPLVGPSVARIKQKNAQWVQLASVWGILNMTDPTAEPGWNSFTPEELVDHIRAAEAEGLKVALRGFPYPVGSDEEDAFNVPHANAWFNQFFVEVGATVLYHAKIAQQEGVSMLILPNFNWAEDNAETQIDKDTRTYINTKWKALIAAVRAIAPAVKLTTDSHVERPEYDWYGDLDYLGDKWWVSIAASSSASVGEMYAAAASELIDKYLPVSQRFGNKPFVFSEVAYYSADTAAQHTYGVYSPQIGDFIPADGTVPSDWDEQARAYEAVLWALAETPWVQGAYSFGYAYFDFDSKSYSIRSKTAEEILKQVYGAINAVDAP